jgi:carboxymethylenebutenolidase
VAADLTAVRDYAVNLPAASGKFASIGFCWGGGVSFIYALASPPERCRGLLRHLPPTPPTTKIKAPVQSHYGGKRRPR